MPTHRWMHPTPRVRLDGTVIEQGDTFEPTELEQKCWPDRFDELEQCQEEKADGEICGRTLPCQYHSEADDG